MKRFELSTLSLARRCSTTELHPQDRGNLPMSVSGIQGGLKSKWDEKPTKEGQEERRGISSNEVVVKK